VTYRRTAVRDVSSLRQRRYSCVFVDVTTLFQIQEVMGRECDAYGREVKCV